MDKEKIKAINRYIAVVDVLVLHLEDVIGSLDDEEYIEESLKDDMGYAKKRINIVNERREELLEIFRGKKQDE